MEVFMRNIAYSADRFEVITEISKVLHGLDYAKHNRGLPINFAVFLHPRKKGSRAGPASHGGTGCLTLPDEQSGRQFLQDCGGSYPSVRVFVGSRRIIFAASKNPIKQDVVNNINRVPFRDPRALRETDNMMKELSDQKVRISTVQFGWECRDEVLSVEWERKYMLSSWLEFDGERREMRLKIAGAEKTENVALLFSQIDYTATSEASGQPVIFFCLLLPPTFESELPQSTLDHISFTHSLVNPRWYGSVYELAPRKRLSSLADPGHLRVAPYASLALRLICESTADLSLFRRLCSIAKLPKPQEFDYRVEHRGLFSVSAMGELETWLATLHWQVAYQALALVTNRSLDAKELLELRGDIQKVLVKGGPKYAAGFLKHFRVEVNKLWWYSDESQSPKENAAKCFQRSLEEFSPGTGRKLLHRLEGDFECLHVTITPTSMSLDGPFPEKSNRVIREYLDHQDCFLRVVFADESRLQYRFDREVDGRGFVKDRVGGILHGGLTLAGRKFEFLAYSQSALKEHAVWFVTPFRDDRIKRMVDASYIIKKLGSFENLEYDTRLIYCPARYGARVSQAFTTTDASITAEAEEIFTIPDIKRNGHCFTDGVGTIAPLIASDINQALGQRRGFGRTRVRPRAFQVRFMGSKGMLSVDYRLKNREICIRPSMIKFEAPSSQHIEIARAFDKPGRMFLNRPLIMLLEGLGVPAQVFLDFQSTAVQEVKEATGSLPQAARLLESHGLGASFRLTSVLASLDKLGLRLDDKFYYRMLDLAVNHVLRELKHHARIPVPGWTLVGVADENSYLKEGTIFACVHDPGSSPVYLEGLVLISRSPTIHPGDVQVVKAIGKPPKGSPFEKETLENTVVFSTQGERSLPSCLGGGDLDGDTYNITDFKLLHPVQTFKPAAYDAAERKELDRPSTMSDVADFIVEYINSDILGIIAINWLIIADQSKEGILDADCLKLAKLHSDAVDYPKSGRPVPITSVPRLKRRDKPDWNAPETVVPGPDFYESSRAIGKLYRAIDLPEIADQFNQRHRRQLPEGDDDGLEIALRGLSVGRSDPTYRIVMRKVSDYIDTSSSDPRELASLNDLFKKYSSELQYICATHSLSYARSAQLSEEEVVIGTIAAKCSQPRRRKERMSSMREQSAALVGEVRDELAGDEKTVTHEERLLRAWCAWELCLVQIQKKVFGAKSFWYICLGAIFEAMKSIEEDERYHAKGW